MAPHAMRPTPQKGGVPCKTTTYSTTGPAFEPTSKRRRGFPSETHVKKGHRVVHGAKELTEKLGRNDPCPCGSGQCFSELLPPQRTLRRQQPQPLLSEDDTDGRPACRGALSTTPCPERLCEAAARCGYMCWPIVNRESQIGNRQSTTDSTSTAPCLRWLWRRGGAGLPSPACKAAPRRRTPKPPRRPRPARWENSCPAAPHRGRR